jgi:hypothetical protein
MLKAEGPRAMLTTEYSEYTGKGAGNFGQDLQDKQDVLTGPKSESGKEPIV